MTAENHSNTTSGAGGSSPFVASVYRNIFKRWRGGRMKWFRETIGPSPSDKILDVGGYSGTWTDQDFKACTIDLLNIDVASDATETRELENGAKVREIAGDGCQLEFEDGSYDIVFSNSVIEHVGSEEDQRRFASEALRVGKRLWIQTPAPTCPIEPHFLGIGTHWIPRSIRPLGARFLSIRGLFGGHSREHLQEIVDLTRLISKRRLKEIFPGCRILTERLGGVIPKSYIVVRDPDHE